MSSVDSPTKKRKCQALQLYDGAHSGLQRQIVFSNKYLQREFKLLEVSPALLDSILASDGDLRLVGARGSEALLCTDTKTFSMKKVESSNSASSSATFTVETAVCEYFEVSPAAGKLDLLHEALQHSVYPTTALAGAYVPHTLEMLLSAVPASRAEIVGALSRAGAVEVDGALRTICKKAHAETLRALMQTAIAQDWDLDSRPVQEADCLAALEAAFLPADPVVLQAVLRSLCAADSPTAGADGVTRHSAAPRAWQLDQRRVRTATARLLLSQPPPGGGEPAGWALQDFLLEWGLVTPGLRSASGEDLALLRGVAVATGDGKVVHLPAEAMAGLDVKARMAALFALRERFLLEELEPYLADLVAAPKTCAELLGQHARAVQDDSSGGGGGAVYCSK